MGVFDQYAVDHDVWTFYDVQLQFANRVMGGTPNNPDIIKGWLSAKAGITDEQEVAAFTAKTLVELGYPVDENMTMEQVKEAMGALEEKAHTNSFKRDDVGLYLEDRVVKAMARESTNILFAGERWGKTKKGPKSFLVERVFFSPSRIHLLRDGQPVREADGTQLFIGHTDGPSGRMSNLTRYEYVERPVLAFQVAVLRDEIGADIWPQIWLLGERNGLGSLRSQSSGQFEVLAWDKRRATLELIQGARAQAAAHAASPLYKDAPAEAEAIVREAAGEARVRANAREVVEATLA